MAILFSVHPVLWSSIYYYYCLCAGDQYTLLTCDKIFYYICILSSIILSVQNKLHYKGFDDL